jgi:hypothetical protein
MICAQCIPIVSSAIHLLTAIGILMGVLYILKIACSMMIRMTAFSNFIMGIPYYKELAIANTVVEKLSTLWPKREMQHDQLLKQSKGI